METQYRLIRKLELPWITVEAGTVKTAEGWCKEAFAMHWPNTFAKNIAVESWLNNPKFFIKNKPVKCHIEKAPHSTRLFFNVPLSEEQIEAILELTKAQKLFP